jgi:tetratricopeptide (TPR) repeat protein
MKCQDVNLPDFLNGNMAGEEMESTLAHLEECPECQAAFQQMLALRVSAPKIKESLPAEFYNFGGKPAAAAGWWGRLAGVAAVLVVLVGGLFLLRGLIRQNPAVRLAEVLENRAYEYIPPVVRGPDDPAASPDRERVMGRYLEGEYDGFLREADAWLSGHPGDERLLFFSGVAAYQLGRHDSAETYLRRALTTDSYRRPEVLWYLANTLLRRQKTDEGRRLLRELAPLEHPYGRRAREVLAVLDRLYPAAL